MNALCGAALAFSAVVLALPARATTLVTSTYSGSVTGYFSLATLQDDFPVGTLVSMSLAYQDSFSSRSACALNLGMSPSASGSLTLGSSVYAITGMSLSFYTFGPTCDDPSPFMGFRLTGTGPATDDGEVFSGVSFVIAPPNLGGFISLIGFGDQNFFVADNGYVTVGGNSAFTQTEVPEPGTLVLLGLGLTGLGASRRKKAA